MSTYIPYKVDPIHVNGKVAVLVTGSEYVKVVNSCKEMWCSSKKGYWGRGMINDKNDPYKVERIGRLGEMAFAKLFELPINLSYIKHGDLYDFSSNGYFLDIKTSLGFPRYNAGLIRYKSPKGKIFNLDKDIYVFCYLNSELIDKEYAEIFFVGWIFRKDINESYIRPAIKGKHFNYQIPYLDLRSMDSLFNYIGEN